MFKLAFALWLTAVAATALRNDRFEIIEPPLNRSPISRIVVLISTLPLEHRVALRYRSFYQNMQQLAINQRDSPSQLWIADIKDLSAIQESIAAIKSELCGRPIDKIFYCGQQELQEFIVGENNNAKLLAASPVASGVIIYNSPVRRGLHQLLRERTNVPVLIVGGAMDGSNRIFRYAEDYFLLKLAPEDRQSAERFLLTILPFHGFCSVVDSTKVVKHRPCVNDFQGALTGEQARGELARLFIDFFHQTHSSGFGLIGDYLKQSAEILQPILNSLLLESSYKLQLPCSQFNDPDPYSVQQPCWLGSAWTELMQEEMLAGGDLNGSYTGLRDRGVRFHLTDELHISWLIRPIHHPKMVTKCRSTTAADYKDCLLVGLTITENYYRGRSSGEETKSAPFTLQTQMEMNSKHDEESLIPWFGPKLPSKYGRFQSPVSAQEIRAKMLSRQRAHVFVGNQSASFQELDGDDERCAELNNLSWHWGLYQIGLIDRPTDRLQSFISRVDARLKRAWKPWADRFPGSFAINATSSSVTKAVRERFQRSGVGLLMADDATAINGGSWIWQPLAYRPIQRDGKIVGVTVRSQMIRNKNDFAVNIFAGLHYCKLLSPARALEWLYTDGYYE